VAEVANVELTALLNRWRAGDRSIEPEVMDAIYPFLRAFAHRQISGDRGLTLQPTELAHEAYLRLAGQAVTDWQSRGHFFAIAARIVRRVVIDYLRERGAEKRGRNELTVSIDLLDEGDLPIAETGVDWLGIDAVLNELERVDAGSVRIIELRYFAGLSIEETAAATGVSRATLVRQWRTARAWLHGRLEGKI
jgi:RNA polymerase sigma factor (TIGR02999 family)